MKFLSVLSIALFGIICSHSVSAGPDGDNAFTAVKQFVDVNVQVLNILIGKANLFQTVPFIGQPVSAVLRQVEAVYDALLFMIVDGKVGQKIVDDLGTLRDKALALKNPAQSITIINGPLIIIGQGPFPQIIVGYTDIISTATTAISAWQSEQGMDDTRKDDIAVQQSILADKIKDAISAYDGLSVGEVARR